MGGMGWDGVGWDGMGMERGGEHTEHTRRRLKTSRSGAGTRAEDAGRHAGRAEGGGCTVAV